MTRARDQVYNFVNRMASFAMQNPNGLDYRTYQSVEAGSQCYEDLELRSLLSQVEDDRAHREAKRLRQRAEVTTIDLLNPCSLHDAKLIMGIADLIDPYEMRDGQLVRKSDGQPVTI